MMPVNARTAIAEDIEVAPSQRSMGELQEALANLSTRDTSDAQACAMRGEIEFLLGRHYDAALSFTSLVTAEPDYASAHYNLGLALLRIERWDRAAAEFKESLRMDDRDNVDACLGIGICLLEQHRPEEALTVFEQCQIYDPQGRAAFGRAAALAMSGRLEEARLAFERLLQSDPIHREVITNLMALAAATGDIQRLEGYSRMLLELDPQSLDALQGLANVAFLRMDFRSAARYCDQIMELAPDCQEASHNFAVATDKLMTQLRGERT